MSPQTDALAEALELTPYLNPQELAELYWCFRELLDSKENNGIELPNDPQLKTDLRASKDGDR